MRSRNWGRATTVLGLSLAGIVACGPGDLVLGDREYGSPDGSVIDNVFQRKDASPGKNHSDMGGSRPPSDAGQPDDSAPDGSTPDGSTPDGWPDASAPDGARPDGPAPDGPVPDSRSPDHGSQDVGPCSNCPVEVDDLPAWFQRDRVQIHTRFHMVPLPSWGSKDWFHEDLFFEAPYQMLRLGVGSFTRHFKSGDEGAWWPSSVGVSHPHAVGRDLAKELLDIAHRAGIRQIAYHLHESDSWAASTHPDWVAVNRNNIPIQGKRGTFMSLASPYLDYLATRIRELAQRGADGIYFDHWHVPPISAGVDFSPHAKALYAAAFGGNINTATNAQLERFRQEIIRRAFTRLTAEIRKGNAKAISLVSGNQVSLGNMRLFDSVKCEPYMWERYPENPGLPGLPLALTAMRDAAEGRPPHLWIRPQDARDARFLGQVLAYGAIYNRDVREFDLEQSTHELNKGYAANFALGRKAGPYFVGARPLGWVRVYLDQNYVVPNQNLPTKTVDTFVSLRRAGLSPGVILDWQIKKGVPQDCEVVVFPQHTSAPPGQAAALAQLTARGGKVLFSQDLSGGWLSAVQARHPPVRGSGGSGMDFVAYRVLGENRLVIAIANGPKSNITIQLEPGFQPTAARDIVLGAPLSISSLGGEKYAISIPKVSNMTLIVVDDEPIEISQAKMLQRLDSESNKISYAGTWSKHVNAYGYDSGGSVRRTTTAGLRASATVFGSCIALGIRKGPLGGKINFYIDGKRVLNGYDTYTPAGKFQQVVYANCGLTAANHQVVFEAAGKTVGDRAYAMLDFIGFR